MPVFPFGPSKGAEYAGSLRFREELFTRFPFTETAKQWFCREIAVVVRNPRSTRGGGFWHPDHRLVELLTAQYEAAIHEYAHAWWHDRRLLDDNTVRLMVAVVHLSEEDREPYKLMARLARDYVYGIRTQRDDRSPTGYWMGMLASGCDWEMYAGLASGCMADIRLLPPYVRPFYDGLFEILPLSAPHA
ncbi:MAG: hypothetical protein M1118_03485, partial [Chloroflexi bacterium]|nr:hypothetical protein [Chloroflexota bacterium]